MQPENQGLISQIMAICQRQDAKQLIKLLRGQTLSVDQKFSFHLRALELRLLLLETYKHAGQQLSELLENRPAKSASGEVDDQLGSFRVRLESFLKEFSQAVDKCIKSVNNPELALDLVIKGLSNPDLAGPIMQLICTPDEQNQEWLIARSFVTKAGVQDSMWGVVTYITGISINEGAQSELTTEDIIETDNIIVHGIEVALEELSMAINGLAPEKKHDD